MPTADLYLLLGLTPAATADEIKAAYKTVSRRFHPDLNSDPAALEELKRVAEAYGVLSDPAQRQAYNLELTRMGGSPLLALAMQFSRPSLHYLDEPQILYVRITVKPSTTSLRLPPPPINLCLVIDRSTSMQGERLERVKAAAQAIIDNLREGDVFCVVSFSDRAEVVVPSLRASAERTGAKARVRSLEAGGGTELLEGLLSGLCTLQPQLSPAAVNHLLLLTDGHTYGDEDRCLLLARLAATDGITISSFGIGEEWNDRFLDDLTGMTGGSAMYINSADQVRNFIEDRVQGMGAAYAERVTMRVLPDPKVKLVSAFRLIPEPGPVSVDAGPLPVGTVPRDTGLAALLKFQVPPLPTTAPSPQPVGRLSVVGDIVGLGRRGERTMADIILPVSTTPSTAKPPPDLLSALSKVAQYGLQERAAQAVVEGNIPTATQCLTALSTRLLASGQTKLAKVALVEARRLEKSQMLSEEGKKNLKYGTRALIGTSALPANNL
jgi:Ca-activated chloride channel family protein